MLILPTRQARPFDITIGGRVIFENFPLNRHNLGETLKKLGARPLLCFELWFVTPGLLASSLWFRYYTITIYCLNQQHLNTPNRPFFVFFG